MQNILPVDIKRLILQEYLNFKDANSLYRSCKSFNNVGYLKNLTNHDTNIYYFCLNFIKHNKTLNNIYLSYINDFSGWLDLTWPKIVNIKYSSGLINPPISKTEELTFYDPSKNININWSKFPKLKKICITCSYIDFSNINLCTELEYIYINCNNIYFPNCICNFKKLKILITNCMIKDNNITFISENIETCIVKNINDNQINFNSKKNIIFDIGYCHNIETYFYNIKF